ncbi:MAG TPA: hypothetical protein VFG04_14510 [Planctomycetaceae bacterium]|jgi:hypothetical protein|nr:hypothetical protein [Planctomycetaceae bacterium]
MVNAFKTCLSCPRCNVGEPLSDYFFAHIRRFASAHNLIEPGSRVVRDLAVACAKQVHIDLEGQETELDKTIIEAIRDPLTHLVRNAVDHGIEPPRERLARGKAEEGRSRSLSRSACSGVTSWALMALARIRCGSMPAPSSNA